MVVEKKILNPRMREILRVLYKKGGAMSAYEIAKETGLSYNTVTKYLEELYKLKIIIPVQDGKPKKNSNKNS